MLLVLVQDQPAYQCENLYTTGCKGITGANPDGTPNSIPIDQEGRNLRILLHSLIDPYWLNQWDKKATRTEVYNFMARKVGDIYVYHPDGSETILFQFHVGYMMHEQLKEAIKIAQNELRKEFG